jgi:hypothetical protein
MTSSRLLLCPTSPRQGPQPTSSCANALGASLRPISDRIDGGSAQPASNQWLYGRASGEPPSNQWLYGRASGEASVQPVAVRTGFGRGLRPTSGCADGAPPRLCPTSDCMDGGIARVELTRITQFRHSDAKAQAR